MTNEYYDHTAYPPIGSAGTSLNARQEFRKIETGLDKLPVLAGNGGKIVIINAGGTALESGATLDNITGVDITSAVSGNVLSYNGTNWVNVAGPTGTIVGTSDAQTLTNKTISGASNTISNIGNASLTNSSVTVGSTAISLGATATTLAGLTNVTSGQFNGAVGSTTPAAGVFTALSASGAFSLSGDQVQISEGGTGATTAAAARVALLPSLATNAGKVLAVNAGATDVEWLAVAGTGTVTSVSGAGTVNGLTLTGTVTTAGNLTLGGTLSGVDLTTAVTGVLPAANGGTGASSLPTGGLVGVSATQTLTNKTISGANNTITNLNASNLTSGTVATGRLGSGTANSTTFLRGDGTWQAVSSGLQTSGDFARTSGTLTFNDSAKIGFGTSNGESTLYSSGAATTLDMTSGNFIIRDGTTTRFTFARTTGVLTATGDVGRSSDLRLKDHVSPIDPATALALICSDGAKPITYTRADFDDGGKLHSGYGAQWLQQTVAGHLVYESDEAGTLAIGYQGMIPYQGAAIIRLKQELDDLKALVHGLQGGRG